MGPASAPSERAAWRPATGQRGPLAAPPRSGYRSLHTLSLDDAGATACETHLRRVWRERGGANPETVRNAIRKPRRKIGDDAGNPGYILGERGLGHRMPGPEDGRGRKRAGRRGVRAARRQLFEFRVYPREFTRTATDAPATRMPAGDPSGSTANRHIPAVRPRVPTGASCGFAAA